VPDIRVDRKVTRATGKAVHTLWKGSASIDLDRQALKYMEYQLSCIDYD